MITNEQITKLSTRKGVARLAVENFLGSLNGLSITEAYENLNQDARAYKWNGPTRTAIAQGISQHFSPR